MLTHTTTLAYPASEVALSRAGSGHAAHPPHCFFVEAVPALRRGFSHSLMNDVSTARSGIASSASTKIGTAMTLFDDPIFRRTR